MTTNVFRPSRVSFTAYGWKGASIYNRADVPTQWVPGATNQDKVVIEQQLAYEWLNSNDSGNSINDQGPRTNMVSTNPAFLSGAAGRLLPGLKEPLQGGAPRILRGFIRRAESDLSDPVAMSRLYFMFNPETITRDYVSYLDQGALDPFNTVFQSGNLVAPPSYMDFTFSLLFDRQEECSDPTHPGVFVDYQYFDLVVRNVIPTSDPNSMNATLPDNGVMMVNPRDITVIFSPQITIQGRPSNARVSFQRFTHRMVPTRMQIDLTMRVVYFGPLKDMNPYVKETDVAASTVPNEDYVDPLLNSSQNVARTASEFNDWLSTETGYNVPVTTPPTGVSPGTLNIALSSIAINTDLMEAARLKVENHLPNRTVYVGPVGYKPWESIDCSGLVWRAFSDAGQLATMGWEGIGANSSVMWERYTAKLSTMPADVAAMATIFVCGSYMNRAQRGSQIDATSGNLRPGDILFRYKQLEEANKGPSAGHIAFFYKWKTAVTGSKGIPLVFDAASSTSDPQVGVRELKYTDLYNFTGALRPLTGT